MGVLALAVLGGLALRLLLLIEAHWRYDYDEGMVGLQVLRILRGARPIFHPGQPYLAALESYLITPLFAGFGANGVTLKLVPCLLSGVYVLTTGWLGTLAYNARIGALSALLAAGSPAYLLVVGTKTWGATAETLVLGNLALISTCIAIDARRSARTRDRALIALAFCGGVGFWVSWLIVFYGVPVLLVLLWRAGPGLMRRRWHLLVAFALGSLPLWAYNLTHDFATFRYLLADQGDTWANARAVLHHLSTDLAPRLVSGDPRWKLLSWPAIWGLQLVYEGGLIALIVLVWRGGWPEAQRGARALLALFVVTVPVLYVLSGYGNHALNPFGFDATGRYLLMIHSALPIGAAALAVTLSRSRLRLPAAALIACTIALNLLGAARIAPAQVFVSPYYTRQPATLRPLIALLDSLRIRHVWTDVGVAHVLMFETNERILAADWYDIYGAKGIVRFPEVPRAIARAQRVAYVEVVLPEQRIAPLEVAFQRAGVPYRAFRPTPHLLVIVPLAPLNPAILGDGMGYQF